MKNNIFQYALCFLLIFIIPSASNHFHAQLKFLVPKNLPDTNFIMPMSQQIHARIFTINKFNNFYISGNSFNNNEHLKFASNKSMAIGIGAVYKIYNFNLSIGLPKLKKFELDYEKTRAIDFQSSLYGRKWVFDIHAQSYKGFFSYNVTNPFQVFGIERTDLIMNTAGLTAYFLTNNSRFSYRAFRINDEWQYKSSGTFLFSISSFVGQIHSNKNKGFIADEYFTSNRYGDVRKKFYFQMGPGGGYAYNLVIRRHFFILTSATCRLLYGINREYTVDNSKHLFGAWNWGYTLLSAVGFQNKFWGINISVINTFNTSGSAVYTEPYRSNVGYVKATFVYRIPSSAFTQRITKPLDFLLKK